VKGPAGGGVCSADEAEDRKGEATEAPRRSWKKERLFIDLLSRLPIEAKAFHVLAFSESPINGGLREQVSYDIVIS